MVSTFTACGELRNQAPRRVEIVPIRVMVQSTYAFRTHTRCWTTYFDLLSAGNRLGIDQTRDRR